MAKFDCGKTSCEPWAPTPLDPPQGVSRNSSDEGPSAHVPSHKTKISMRSQSQHLIWGASAIILILEMRKLKVKELRGLPQDHRPTDDLGDR